MHKIVLLTAVAALAGCSSDSAPPADDANITIDANLGADANAVDANTAETAAMSMNETSWEFTQDGKAIQESVDAKGNYIANSGKEHIDHGTVVMKDGKACFTSAMTKDGEVCWTNPMLAEGASGETTSDKGEKLTVKRTAYVPLTY